MSSDKRTLNLGYDIKNTQHILRICMDEALRPLGITTPQYAALSTIEQKPGISNAGLARASFVTAQTMHDIVLNLEKTKLLKRSADPHHGRIIRSELTKRGQGVLAQAHALLDQLEGKMTDSLSGKDIANLKRLLAECSSNLSRL